MSTAFASKWIETNNNAVTITAFDHSNRLRLKVPVLKINPKIVNSFNEFLANQTEIQSYFIRKQTGSVTIEVFDQRQKKAVHNKIENYFVKPMPLATPSKRKLKLITSKEEKSSFSPIYWHTLPTNQISELQHVSYHQGLTEQQARAKLLQFGQNKLKSVPPLTAAEILINQFKGLPVGLLGTAAAVSIITGGILDAFMITGVLGVNAIIGFKNDSQVEKTLHSLKKRKWQKQTVKRNGKKVLIPTEELVPGDILYLKRGSMIPADCRILTAQSITVDEAALTGESRPVFKDPNWTGINHTPIAERKNMLFKGTAVTGGACKAVVVATGNKTQIGIIQHLMETTAKPQTPIQKQMDQLGNHLSWASLGLCGFSFTLGVIRKKPLLELFKSSVSLAIAAIPEGLPMVATTTLSRGVKTLKDKNLLVRNLVAVEALGNIHHLCLDKTGTITTDEMILEKILIGETYYKIPSHNQHVCALLEILVLNNEVRISDNALEGSSTEKALIMAALQEGISVEELRLKFPIKNIVERTQNRHYMLTEHSISKSKNFITAKGNPKELLKMCSHYYDDGIVKKLTKKKVEQIIAANYALSSETLRILAVAYRNHPSLKNAQGDQFTFMGLVSLKDKIKTGIKDLITALNMAGIQVSMITGDQSHTAQAIADIIGLGEKDNLNLHNVNQLDELIAQNKAEVIAATDVFSRVSPEHKLRIIEALQNQKRIVAMTGDGINDGPALKKADIGIAMGNQGTDVAIEVADVILLDDDLTTILSGVKEGRNIKENIKRSVEFILATNIGEIGLALSSQIIGLPEPCNATQYLWINLLTDIFPEIALASEPAREDILSYKATAPGHPLIERSDLNELFLDSSSMVASAMASYLLGLKKYGQGPSARSMAFINLTTAQMFYMLGARFKKPLWHTGLKLRQNPKIPIAFICGISLQNMALFIPGLKRILGMGNIGPIDWLTCQSLALVPLLIREIRKNSIINKETENVR